MLPGPINPIVVVAGIHIHSVTADTVNNQVQHSNRIALHRIATVTCMLMVLACISFGKRPTLYAVTIIILPGRRSHIPKKAIARIPILTTDTFIKGCRWIVHREFYTVGICAVVVADDDSVIS